MIQLSHATLEASEHVYWRISNDEASIFGSDNYLVVARRVHSAR